MEILQGVWKQHLRPRAVVGYGVKIFLPSPPNYVPRSPGRDQSFISGGWAEANGVGSCIFVDLKMGGYIKLYNHF